MKLKVLTAVLLSYGLTSSIAFASPGSQFYFEEKLNLKFSGLNTELNFMLRTSSETIQFMHKLPNAFVADNTINLLVLAESIDEALRSKPTLDTKVSELPKESLERYNRASLEALNELKGNNSQGITADEAKKLLKTVHEHSVAGIKAMDVYDPIKPNGQRSHGFCFGRADMVFWELLKMGVPKSNILKMFQIGAIYGDKTMGRPWSNHIVTIVRAKSGGWYAIDPLYNELMTPEQWYEKNVGFTANGETFLFFGSPHRMYAQGGINTIQGIWDLNYPLSRSKAKDPAGATHENLFVFKDDVWQKYYKDLLKTIIPENLSNDEDREFCHQSELCELSK